MSDRWRSPTAADHDEGDDSSNDPPCKEACDCPVTGVGIAIAVRRCSVTDSGVGLDRQDAEVADDRHCNPSGSDDQEGRYPPHGLMVSAPGIRSLSTGGPRHP